MTMEEELLPRGETGFYEVIARNPSQKFAMTHFFSCIHIPIDSKNHLLTHELSLLGIPASLTFSESVSSIYGKNP